MKSEKQTLVSKVYTKPQTSRVYTFEKKILSWGIQGGLYRDELSKCSFSLGDNHREKKQIFMEYPGFETLPAPDP